MVSFAAAPAACAARAALMQCSVGTAPPLRTRSSFCSVSGCPRLSASLPSRCVCCRSATARGASRMRSRSAAGSAAGLTITAAGSCSVAESPCGWVRANATLAPSSPSTTTSSATAATPNSSCATAAVARASTTISSSAANAPIAIVRTPAGAAAAPTSSVSEVALATTAAASRRSIGAAVCATAPAAANCALPELLAARLFLRFGRSLAGLTASSPSITTSAATSAAAAAAAAAATSAAAAAAAVAPCALPEPLTARLLLRFGRLFTGVCGAAAPWRCLEMVTATSLHP